MSIFLWLLVAHFLADFPLQTNKVYKLKCTNFVGGLVHGGGVLLALLVILFPYLDSPQAWIGIATIVCGHFIQDAAQEPWVRHSLRSFRGYILDQTGHMWWSFLVWIIYFIPLAGFLGKEFSLYENIISPLFILGLLLVTYVWETTVFLWREDENTPFSRNYKHLVIRGVVYSIVFIGSLFLITFL